MVGHYAPVDKAVAIFERVASSNEHRALLLGVEALAPLDHAAARGLLDATEPFPAILDDLGQHRLQAAVPGRLAERLIDPEADPEMVPVSN